MSTNVKKEQARDSAEQATDKAREAAGHTGEAIQHAAGAVGEQAEKATAKVGSGVQYAADKVRENLPREGMVGSAARGVADTLEGAGKYIEDKNLSGMMDDVTGLIRRNPVPAVLVGLGVGFLIGRVLSSSSSSRS